MTPQVRRCTGGMYHAVVRPKRNVKVAFVALIEKRKGKWILETTRRLLFPTLRALKRYLTDHYIAA